jgi:hypothetical protein
LQLSDKPELEAPTFPSPKLFTQGSHDSWLNVQIWGSLSVVVAKNHFSWLPSMVGAADCH